MGEPDLYRAALSYIHGVLDAQRKRYDTLKRFGVVMEASTDRRARFVAALKFWQFEQAAARGLEPDLLKLNIQQFVDSNADAVSIVMYDKKLQAIADGLVKISVTA